MASEYEGLLHQELCYSTGEYDENDEPIYVYTELPEDEKEEYRKKLMRYITKFRF